MEPSAHRPYKTAERAILSLLGGDVDYLERFRKVTALSRKVRSSEYLLTNACNIRCEGCWFFEHDFDKGTRELKSVDDVREFAKRERERGITYAIIIGGEPTLIPERVAAFVEVMDYVTISTNGLRRLPVDGFENVAVQISLFGGGQLDDKLRAIKPGGQRFTGLFDTALRNYEGDRRACFVYAITEDGIEHIEDTVRRIHENGNRVSLNFYSKYNGDEPLRMENAPRLVEEALRVKALFPDTLLSHPYFIRAIVTGESHWGTFGYDVCPSLSVDHPAHAARLANGNPVLPRFNAWAADCSTVNFCCTSGHCGDCRDSQAVLSWILVSLDRFRESGGHLKTWIEISESYWKQFCWAPYDAQSTLAQPRRALPLVSNAV
ncbi:radical SAM protein [Sorangium cellulosum]|uniref:Radical SAM protein n=1 Tax=Sorangium cellulosum TaxID=56 RepID=A0A4P2PYE4_SORCE|nr:radical SAM protein [Sorangium cellulosum]AUX21864.1 radical SAM protein [Sorangium cellulosum]